MTEGGTPFSYASSGETGDSRNSREESYGRLRKRSHSRSQQAWNRAPWHGQEGQLVHSGISGSQPGGFRTGSGIVSSDTGSKVIGGVRDEDRPRWAFCDD